MGQSKNGFRIRKVKCCLSGHEMPLNKQSIIDYINGTKYKRLKEKNDHDNEISQFKEFIVPSTKRKHQLFCKLTLNHLNPYPVHHILKHIRGKKFIKAYSRWVECQKNGEEFVPAPLLSKYKLKSEEEDVNGTEFFSEEDNKSLLEDSYTLSSTIEADEESSTIKDNEESAYESDDSFSDLYPPEDFIEEDELNNKESDKNNSLKRKIKDCHTKSSPRKKKKK